MTETTNPPSTSVGGRTNTAERPIEAVLYVAMMALEKLFLIGVAALTVYAGYLDLRDIFEPAATPGDAVRRVDLAVVLQFFLYAEVVAMVAVFFTRSGQLFTFPLLIAMTALARLMVIEGKDFPAEGFVFQAAAILLLSIAVAVLAKYLPNAD